MERGPAFLMRVRSTARRVMAATGVLFLGAMGVPGSSSAQVEPVGQIMGHVRDGMEVPLGGISVTAYHAVEGYDRGDGAPHGYVMEPFVSVETDSSGAYDIPGLPADSYVVGFSDPSGDHAFEFFDDSTNVLTDATRVAVAGGATVMGVNAVLAPARRITGTVTAPDGAGLPSVTVTAYSEMVVGEWPSGFGPRSDWRPVASARTDPEGVFAVGGLSPGPYRLGFHDDRGDFVPEYFEDAGAVYAGDDIVVPPSATAPEVDATLAVAGHIAGAVTDADGSPVAGVRVTIHDRGTLVETVTTNASGTYDAGGLAPGAYTVFFDDPSGDRLWEWYDNALSQLGAELVFVASGETARDVDARLTRSARITGTVTDASGAGLPGIRVIGHYVSEATALPGSTTDVAGDYSLTRLRPGRYVVQFADALDRYPTEYFDDSPTFEGAIRIDVVAGQVVTGVDARLSLPPVSSTPAPLPLPQPPQPTADPSPVGSVSRHGLTVRARAINERGRLLVNVDPARDTGSWSFRIQRRVAPGTWRMHTRAYRTRGRREIRAVDLPRGTYRVVVRAQNGYTGAVSRSVRLRH